MTKEPIMIDDVDVAECRHFNYGEGYNQETEEFVDGACECITAHDSYGEFMYYGICKDRNCYFKQLKRKEEECEEWAKKYERLEKINLEEYENHCDTKWNLQYRNLALIEENKKLKADNEKIDATNERLVREKYDLHQDILQLKAENEVLKAELNKKYIREDIKKYCPFFFRDTATCLGRDLNEIGQLKFCNKYHNCWIKKVSRENLKLKQALREIKEVAEENIKEKCHNPDWNDVLKKCEVIDEK